MMFLLVYIILGIVAGTLSGMLGIGGGVIMVPALHMIFKHLHQFPIRMVMPMASASSLTIILPTILVSAFTYQRRQLVDWWWVKRIAPMMILGTLIGAYLVPYLPTRFLEILLALILIYNSSRFFIAQKKHTITSAPSLKIILSYGFLTGLIAGLIGLGGGVMLIPFLNYFSLPFPLASGISVNCAAPAAFMGVMEFILSHHSSYAAIPHTTGLIYWPAVIPVAICSMASVKFGAYISQKVSINILRKAFGVLLFTVAIKLFLG